MNTIDLNCDVGEGSGGETTLLPLVSSANIACGGHAGDDVTMAKTFDLALANNVCPGAHPGYADRGHFGRRELAMPADELRRMVIDQLASLRRHGEFRYVKPHGALYNQAAKSEAVARTVVAAVREFDPTLWVMGLAGSEFLRVAEKAGLRTASEAFADRAYDAEGRLVSRQQPGAVIESEDKAVAQVLELVRAGRVRSVTGAWVVVRAESICVHGDNPRAVRLAQRLRAVFRRESIAVKPFWPSA